MKLTDKEALKVLAEAIKESQTTTNPEDADRCTFCYKEHSIKYNKYPHESDCPALLAEEVLNRCPTCNGLKMIACHAGNGVFINTTCEQCNGTGLKK